MSYQVLARKYRPATFEALEGQEHVLRALVNALENNRLHHAYLFTGTRGIGKTTIARILAKCLNCEQGVSATPCGTCSTCLEIAEGRSVDLIEYDAASRTKVEDTREILDNVQYMPSRNRFKVYLIDEVHMLSNHSFNALLKTLEEPPEHVKFLLATTDPKKLPVTVLSRCLQFNLKNISPERVVKYLRQVLVSEDIEFDEAALWQLGRAADGSMRDALSLTDQAISFGNNSVNDADVKTMLGNIDHREVYGMINCLIEKDASALLDKIKALADFSPDYSMLLAELLSVLHRIAVAQAVSDAIDNSLGDRDLVLAVADSISREDVQLYYQIGLIGQRDLPYSPDPRTGFEMIMLRMLSFTLTSISLPGHDADPVEEPAKKKTASLGPRSRRPSTTPAEIPLEPDMATQLDVKRPELDPLHWSEILPKLKLSGVTQSLASNCALQSVTESLKKIECELVLNEHHASLWNNTHEKRISDALSEFFSREIRVRVSVATTTIETPADVEKRMQDVAHAEAVLLIENDEKILKIIESFDGKLDRESIVARGSKL